MLLIMFQPLSVQDQLKGLLPDSVGAVKLETKQIAEQASFGANLGIGEKQFQLRFEE